MALYLIGTCHVDPKGPRRLEKLLSWINPDILGVEVDPKNISLHRKTHRLFEKYASTSYDFVKDKASSDELNTLTTFLFVNQYEFWVSDKFVRQNPDVNFRAWDRVPPINMELRLAKIFGYKIDDSEEVKILSIIRTLRTKWPQEKIDQIYDHVPELEDYMEENDLKPFLFDRDDFTAEKIRNALPNSKTNLVYVGGARHIFGEYDNLYEKLKDLNPIRIKLKEADEFN